jgi:hypothetical protein
MPTKNIGYCWKRLIIWKRQNRTAIAALLRRFALMSFSGKPVTDVNHLLNAGNEGMVRYR